MHQITLVQGLLLAIMAIIVGVDFYLEVLFIFRPIIVGTLSGIILGDIKTGVLAAGLVELAFAGLTPAGGTQPPNPILAAIMTVVLSYTTGADVKTTIGLSFPFSFLMQYIILFYYSTFSLFVAKFDKYSSEADTKSYKKLSMITISIVALSYGIIVFLCAYMAQEPMRILVNSMPEWLAHGFEIAGGILPAIGFGMLLKIMFKIEYFPYLIIGFLVATFLNFSNLLPVALIGFAIAGYKFFEEKQNEEKMKAFKMVEREEEEDGI